MSRDLPLLHIARINVLAQLGIELLGGRDERKEWAARDQSSCQIGRPVEKRSPYYKDVRVESVVNED